MAVPLLNADELVAHLRKTSLPTVLIEGVDDVKVYRNIETQLGLGKMDFLSCGGRNTVTEVYRRRADYAGIKVAFLADQDLWYFQGKPSEFSDMLCTHGWSLENDLYHDGRERLHDLLDAHENGYFNTLIQDTARWFAFEVDRSLEGEARDFAKFTLSSDKVTDKGIWALRHDFLDERGWVTPNAATHAKVCEHSFSGMRGKFIFDCFTKIFIQSRDATAVKYSGHHLMDLCYREGIKPSNPTSRINQTIAALQAKLQ